MPCFDTLKEALRRKRPSEQRISKSCIACSPSWPILASQASHPSQAVATPPSPHLWNLRPTPSSTTLEQHPKWNSSWYSLCQRQRGETTTARTARQWQRGKSAESWGPFKGLKKRWGSAPILRPPIYPRDHPLRDDKLSPQWSSYRAFWHWQDNRVGWPKILLAKPEEGRWGLYPRMWRLSGFKSH